MMTGTKKHKIYPSASGWAKGRGIEAEYESACLRYMLVAQKSPFTPIDPMFAKVGAHHEDWYAEKLGANVKHREFVMKSEPIPGVEYSGRCDFITQDGIVHETKASFSKNFLASVIKKGQYKKSHLAQLVSYLIELKQTKGRIVAGYYEQNDADQFVQKGYREFQVEIDDQGRVLVDGVDSGYTVYNQLGHRLLAAEVLSQQKIHDRPINAEGFVSPCNYCPMAGVCDRYDNAQLGKNEFIQQGIEAIKNKKPLVAKVEREKTNGTKRTKTNSRAHKQGL